MSIHRIAQGKYDVRFRDASGRERRKRLYSHEAAKEFERRVKNEAVLGSSGDFWTKGTESFGDFAKAWLIRKGPNLRQSTLDLYGELLDRFLVPTLGKTPLRAIDVPLIEDMRDDLLAK